MEYAVLIERKKEGWRAFILALADLGAEGGSRDEAVRERAASCGSVFSIRRSHHH